MPIAFIDHYDSFSFNVLDWLQRSAAQQLKQKLDIIHIYCDDEVHLLKLKNNPIPTVISPGPGTATDYPRTLQLLEALQLSTSILGVCLGHQMIGRMFGGIVVRAKEPWHGTKTNVTVLSKNWLTEGLPQKFAAISYNSLVASNTLNTASPLKTIAVNAHDEAMIFIHEHLPIASVQFHPESFGSDQMNQLAMNFFKKAGLLQ